MKTTVFIVLALFSTVCSSAQVKKQRLVGKATYYSTNKVNFGFGDSTSFKYSGTRYSKLDFISLNWEYFMSSCNTQHELFQPRRYFTPTSIINSIIVPNNIDSLQYARVADFDTMAYYRAKGNKKALYTCSYYSDGKLKHATDNDSINIDYIYYFGDLYRTRKVFGGRDTNWHLYGRDAYGNVVMDYADGENIYLYEADDSIKVLYEFDSLHRYTSRSKYWNYAQAPDYRDYYDYYPDGKVKTIRHGTIFGPSGTFDLDMIDEFSYTPGVPGYTGRTCFDVFGNEVWFQDVTHVNSQGLIDTLARIWLGGLFTDTMSIEYNSIGNPTVVTLLETGPNYKRHFYYYEDYDPSLSTESISKPLSSTITLSPNPTKGIITLHHLPNAPLTVLISNMMGQLLQKETIHAKGSDASISLGAGTAPGIYTISVSGSNNSVLYRGTFLKQ